MTGLASVEVVERGLVSGSYHGPANFPLMLQELSEIEVLGLGVPLIACGGVHSFDDVEILLRAGVTALQLDSALWVEPGLAGEIVDAWSAAKKQESG